MRLSELTFNIDFIKLRTIIFLKTRKNIWVVFSRDTR